MDGDRSETDNSARGISHVSAVRWIGYVACSWAFLFAAAHVYWGFGGQIGLFGTSDTLLMFAADPTMYILSWTLSVFLFTTIGLFPLALVCPGEWLHQRQLQRVALVLGYLGMTLVALYGFLISHEVIMGLAGLGVCLLGAVVAVARPGDVPILQWMVYVATWTLGLGMILYGVSYLVIAVLNVSTKYFLIYLITGGMSWTIEGVLFVATAWMARDWSSIRDTVVSLQVE